MGYLNILLEVLSSEVVRKRNKSPNRLRRKNPSLSADDTIMIIPKVGREVEKLDYLDVVVENVKIVQSF